MGLAEGCGRPGIGEAGEQERAVGTLLGVVQRLGAVRGLEGEAERMQRIRLLQVRAGQGAVGKGLA